MSWALFTNLIKKWNLVICTFFYSVDFDSHPKDVIYSLNQLVLYKNNLPCLNQKLYFFFLPLNRKTALSWMELWWSAHRDCQVLLMGSSSITATGCASSSVCVRMGHCSRFRWQVIIWVVRLLSIHVEPRTKTQTTNRRVLFCVYVYLYEVIACLQGFLFLQQFILTFIT